MKRIMVILCLLALGLMLGCKSEVKETPASPQVQSAAVNNACTPPTQVGSSIEQTAWQLFVAATCPVNSAQYPFVTWEQWIEQNQLYNVPNAMMTTQSGERPRFHMSPLASAMQAKAKAKGVPQAPLPQVANQGCNSQTWSQRTICEEARLNADAQSYISSNNLTTIQGQLQFVAAGSAFQFPAPAVEIKADWIQLSSCSNPPSGVHVENINNTCYALGGMHLISKLVNKWIWATFEPQNSTTNPQRCVVLGCSDSWGSSPAQSSGASTQLTPALQALMSQANLAPEWFNYRLDGVQTDFLDSSGQPTRLGNSIIEGDNAGTPTLMKTSSCITCHDFSTINKQGTSMPPNFITGVPAITPGYVTRDFVWSLSLAQ